MHREYNWLGWIEKELSPDERKRAEAHLAACPECRAAMLELAGLTSDLRAVARIALPKNKAAWPALWARVQGPTMRIYPPRQLAASLSVLVACLIFLNVWASRFSQRTPLTDGVAQPQAQVILQTPQPPGSVAALTTPATQPMELNQANTAAPHAVPAATPVPDPTS